jgi:hypothetical protein
MEQVHVEIPAGSDRALLEVPVSVLNVADETDLVLTVAPFPGLPSLLLVVITERGEGIPVHVEIADGSSVALLELPAEVGALDPQDEENLLVLSGIPGALLVLLKHTAPG